MDDTERDLIELKKQLAGLAKVMSKSNKTILENSKSSKMFTALQKVVNKTMGNYQDKVKAGEGYFHEFNDAIDAAKDDVKKFGRSIKAMPSPLGLVSKGLTFLKDAVIGVGVAMAKTALALSDTTVSIKGLEDLVDQGFGELPYAGKLLQQFGREIDSNVESFSQLAKMGATFGSSIVMLRQAQADSMMPLAKFTDLIGKNSTTLAKLFGTVDRGVPQISGLMDRLGILTMQEFGKFGLTLDDTSEYLGTFLELERARGNMQRFTQAELLAGTREYTSNLVTLSKLTGESVDTLNEQNLAMAADGVFQAQLNKMSANDAKTLSLGISALTPNFKQLAREIIGIGAPISETSRGLVAMDSRFQDVIEQFAIDKDIVAFQNNIKTLSAGLLQNGETFADATLAGVNMFAGGLNDAAIAAGEAVDPDAISQEKQARGDNIVELRNLATQTDRLKSAFETARFSILDEFLYKDDSLINVGKFLNDQFEGMASEHLPKLAKGIEHFFKLTTGIDVSEMDPNAGKKESKWYKPWTWFSGNDTGYGGIDDYGDALQFNRGSDGFRNFGSGTPAVLHGVEAVVPKNNISQMQNLLDEVMASKTKASGVRDLVERETYTNNSTTNVDMTQLNVNTTELIKLNKKVTEQLNTLVTIGAMTEKNTKNTQNNLANMTGSLI